MSLRHFPHRRVAPMRFDRRAGDLHLPQSVAPMVWAILKSPLERFAKLRRGRRCSFQTPAKMPANGGEVTLTGREPSRISRANRGASPRQAAQRRTSRETDLSTEQTGAQAAPRFSQPHGEQGRPQGFSLASRAGAQEAKCLNATGVRLRRGQLWFFCRTLIVTLGLQHWLRVRSREARCLQSR